MTRDELLNQIQHDRLELEGLLGQASDSVRTAPVLANGWSIKDLLGAARRFDVPVLKRRPGTRPKTGQPDL
jgi:hypothetical protein